MNRILLTLVIVGSLFAAGCKDKGPVDHAGQGLAHAGKGEYDKAWADVHKAQDLGHRIDANLLDALREISGREE